MRRCPGGQAVAIIVLVALTTACAAPPRVPVLVAVGPGGDPWAVVMGLEEGQLVVVGLAASSPNRSSLGGEFPALLAGSDAETLELRTGVNYLGSGQAIGSVTLSRAEIQYLQVPGTVERSSKGTWIGTVIGASAGVGTALAWHYSNDCSWQADCFTPVLMVIFGAALGGIGAAFGRGFDKRGTEIDFVTVYGAEAAAGGELGPAGEVKESGSEASRRPDHQLGVAPVGVVSHP